MVSGCTSNANMLYDIPTINGFEMILKINHTVAKSIGNTFMFVMKGLFP